MADAMVMVAQDWAEVGCVEDIPRLGSRVVTTSIGDVAVFRAADDAIFVLRDKCPHKGGPLSQGIVHGKRVTCPLHSWVVELDTGTAVAPDVGCTKSIPCRVEGGRIQIKLTAVKPAA
jgi:nitrite reductase (NADH) small subunit